MKTVSPLSLIAVCLLVGGIGHVTNHRFQRVGAGGRRGC